jgi:hypothetical protein
MRRAFIAYPCNTESGAAKTAIDADNGASPHSKGQTYNARACPRDVRSARPDVEKSSMEIHAPHAHWKIDGNSVLTFCHLSPVRAKRWTKGELAVIHNGYQLRRNPNCCLQISMCVKLLQYLLEGFYGSIQPSAISIQPACFLG